MFHPNLTSFVLCALIMGMAPSYAVEERLYVSKSELSNPLRALIVGFISLSYNRDKVFRVCGGVVGVLCVAAILNRV